jgi:hypothetical protein
MSANAKIVDPVKGRSTLVRPRFSPGLLLRDDDLQQGVEYTRDLSRLLFRSLFGCGVVCGLVVETRIECGKLIVTVASGVGLTCLGDPVHVPKPVSVTIDPTCGKPIPNPLWVILCRTERCCAPRSAVCSCDDDDDTAPVCTREHEGFEIRILGENPDCACGCPEPEAEARPAKPKAKAGARAAASRTPAESTAGQEGADGCWCADPASACYHDHYMGDCACECCDCECVVLARIVGEREGDGKDGDIARWTPDHRVRRYVRPVLMRDPQVWKELHGADASEPAK